MIGRLPESWIPPDHLLDLRSKVRLRHTLVDQRGEWQQRIRAVLYHHGLPQRAELHLLSGEGRAWLQKADVPDAAREQIEVAIARRFSSSRQAVRYSGLDVTVYQSDQHRSPGHLARQGPPVLRWALYEAAQAARRPSSPDRGYYDQAAERLGSNRACVAIARKLLARSYHTLRELGEEALQPA